ncbi:helicase-exonuclease AddAB subunit AddB [Sedimentibacter sp.]|uniref:helicase-exonuclease AddAB subunit AddB n=1 Tax=Sedimentibacter sp. TaxID=1960295 RepID=UPI0028B26328|nr:helicase-exonuclease AddAB subunit AddB [Sedimentibacter sp.]
MGLNIVLGRAKSGKSTYIYDDIKKNIEKNNNTNLLLIVSEQMTYQAEYEIIDRIDNQGIMAAEVLSIKRLGYKVLEEVGGLKVQEINNYGKVMLLKQIFEENKDNLKVFTKAVKQEGFLREFDALISELKQNCISAEFLEQVAKYNIKDEKNQLLNKKIEDIAVIYKEIQKRTHDRFYDEEDKMELFISAVEKSDFIKNSIIWIDGFESFDMQRHNLIKELIKNAKSVTISLNMEASYLKLFHSREDWEVFKIVHDTYSTLVKDLNCDINIIPINENRFTDEIKTIERSMFTVNTDKYSDATLNIHIISSLNPYSEVEKIAIKIVSLIRDNGYRWKDISVASSDMDSYGINIKKIFTQYEIPYFLDTKRDIMGNPLTKFILSVLDMFNYNFKHDSVFEFLKTGFTSLDYDEISKLENFALQYGIEGSKWFKPFNFNAGQIDYFEELRERFTKDLKDYKKKYGGYNNALDITLFLYDFLKSYKVQEKIEKQVNIFKKSEMYEISGENAQIWNYVMDIFEQIILAGHDTLITPIEYKKMLESGFREVMVSIIPPSLDKVTVSDIHKISVKPAKVLFIIGANEGKLDSKNSEKGLLLDDERDLLSKSGLKLLIDSNYYIYKEKHLLYKLFTNASDKLFLSYCLGTSDGKSMHPSMYADRIKQLFPLVKEESDLIEISEDEKISNNKGTVDYLINSIRNYIEGNSIEPVWKDVYSWYEANDDNIIKIINQGISYENKAEKIKDENLKKIYFEPITISVSKIENFASCPFKFFMDSVIKPQPKIVQKVEFYDLGNIYHVSVEEFTKSLNNLDIMDLDKEKINSLSLDVTEKVLIDNETDYLALDANERNKYMKEKIKRLVNRAASTIVNQLQRGNFRPGYTELIIGNDDCEFKIDAIEIKIDDDISVYFQGRIDRVDILKKDDNVYINIIDYKSSFKDIDLSDALQGLQLQLLVYMSAIIKNGEKLFCSKPEIGGIYYFVIDDPMIDSDDVSENNIEAEIINKLSLKGYTVEDEDIILNMDKDINNSRKSDIIPVSLNKDGSTSKSSKTLTDKEFKMLLDKIDSVAKQTAERVLKGNIDIMPYRKVNGGKTPCNYCDFTSVCQFDPSVDGNNYRRINKLKKEDVLREIMQEGGDVDEIQS